LDVCKIYLIASNEKGYISETQGLLDLKQLKNNQSLYLHLIYTNANCDMASMASSSV